MASDSSRLGGRPTLVPASIGALGPLNVLALLVQWLVFRPATFGLQVSASQLGEFAFNAVFGAGFVVAGYWLARSDIRPQWHGRILAWSVGGLLGFLGVNLLLILIVPAPTAETNFAWARGTAMFGAAGGVTIGTIEARSIERAHAAERAVAQREFAESQREWFDYLNAILRHEVLNKANVVQGRATLVAESTEDDDVRSAMETIRNQTEHMVAVIDDVRALVDTSNTTDFAPVYLPRVLRDTVADVRDTYDDVEIDTSIPSGVYVRGDDLLPRIFDNLVENAIVHNDTGTAKVRVAVTPQEDHVDVTVSDNGPGIPESGRETLFERRRSTGSTHGLGLYLVRTMVERYDGSIELRDTGPSGTTFSVTLPRAPEPPVDGSGRHETAVGNLLPR